MRHLLLSAVVALLVLTLCEGGLRLAGVYGRTAMEPPPWMDGETYEQWKGWTERLGIEFSDVTDLEGWRWNPLLRWSLKPNVDLTARNIFLDPALGAAARWKLTTNSRGFRTPEFESEKAPGTARVVVLGDSNSMGWLLDNEEAYPRRLEAHLAALLGRPVEVINLAVGGYTSFSALQLWRREAMALSPDALVVSCGANDGQRMQTTDEQYAAAFSGTLGRFRHWLGGLKLTALLGRIRSGGESALVPRVGPEQFGVNLSLVAAEAREKGIPLVFLRVCFTGGAYQEELEKVISRFRIPLVAAEDEIVRAVSKPEVRRRSAALITEIDSWYSIEEKRADRSLLFLFRDGCHLNPLGADLVAAALAEDLGELLERGAAEQ
jgi:lysophospholipase L1-like esterase